MIVCDSEEFGLPLCDREVSFATFDIFLIFAKPVVNLPSSAFLQLINNFFVSLNEYLTLIGVTSKSFGSHQGFAKNYSFGRFPVTITTPVAFFNNFHRRPSPGRIQIPIN